MEADGKNGGRRKNGDLRKKWDRVEKASLLWYNYKY